LLASFFRGYPIGTKVLLASFFPYYPIGTKVLLASFFPDYPIGTKVLFASFFRPTNQDVSGDGRPIDQTHLGAAQKQMFFVPYYTHAKLA
jgi:hypothetical protein